MIREFPGGVRYSTVVVSDLQRGGIGVELHWHFQRHDHVVAKIFASTLDGSWTLNTFDGEVPVELIKELIAEAEYRIRRYKPNESCEGHG